jgi:hypothetical protein
MKPPSPDFAHLLRLSDDTGLFEHARFAVVRRECGYCTDDVARGLVVVCREPGPPPSVNDLAGRYLTFLTHAQAANGGFHNRLGFDRRWLDRPAFGDWWGRALWGLGTAAARSPVPWIREGALEAFDRSVATRTRAVRAMAFAGLGAAEVLRSYPEHALAAALLNDAAVAIGVPSPEADWPWPQAKLTYANAALAEVLIAAGDLLADRTRLDHGLALLGWLHEVQTNDGRLSVVAAAGWQRRSPRTAFDQQPIEVAALADAFVTATGASGDGCWHAALSQAVGWFLGDNDASVVMWDPRTGGGYDGLTPHGPNLNQGAESTLALISTLQHGRSSGATDTSLPDLSRPADA